MEQTRTDLAQFNLSLLGVLMKLEYDAIHSRNVTITLLVTVMRVTLQERSRLGS